MYSSQVTDNLVILKYQFMYAKTYYVQNILL